MKPHEKPYPQNCNHEIYGQYIGQRVVNVHNPQYGTGEILNVEKGCNGLIRVRWEWPFPRCHSPSDLALESCWPAKRWTHDD